MPEHNLDDLAKINTFKLRYILQCVNFIKTLQIHYYKVMRIILITRLAETHFQKYLNCISIIIFYHLSNYLLFND
jgi:hypothetical protein